MDVGVKDIDQLREFAQYLQWLSGSMVDEFSKASSMMAAANENWHDDENARFMDEFSGSVNQINQIAERMDEYSRFVLRKCEILDLYHNS